MYFSFVIMKLQYEKSLLSVLHTVLMMIEVRDFKTKKEFSSCLKNVLTMIIEVK